MRVRGLSLSLLLALLSACVEVPPAANDDESGSGSSESGTASESESGSLPSDTTESDDETATETETETGTDPDDFDPSCGEWTSTLVQADRLRDVWLDGDDLIATGGRALVQRDGGGAWSDYVDFSLDGHINAYDQVWGPPGDRWVIARDSTFAPVIYRFDGDSLTLSVAVPHNFPNTSDMRGRELVGRGPDDVWVLAVPTCTCFFTPPPCGCEDLSVLGHWDGQIWSVVPTPGRLLDIALTETGMWGVGEDGLIAHYDGQSWTVDDAVGPATLEHVWALDDEEVWVGGKDAQLMQRSGGVWTNFELPEPWMDIIALEGRAPDRVWALDDFHGLWAWDGTEWSQLAMLEDAGGLAIVGEGESLIVVGGEQQHMVWQVDTADGNVTLLHERSHIDVWSIVADDVDHMLLSSPTLGRSTWRMTDGVWAPVYEQQLEYGFSALLGPTDAAMGVRSNKTNPSGVWQLGEDATPLTDPIEDGLFWEVVEFEGQPWVAGRDDSGFGDADPFVYAYDGVSWTDHSPPLSGSANLVTRLSATDDRLFARLEGDQADKLMYLEGEDWTSIPNALGDPLLAFGDIAATATDRLWATAYTHLQPNQMQLMMWDGVEWHDAFSLWPQLAEQCCWHNFAQAGDGRLWLLSAGYDQSEQLAYFDGNDWAIVDTPPQLHGWNELPSEMAVASDGLFIYDGIYVLRYEFCPE
jgi:hypothetical protein